MSDARPSQTVVISNARPLELEQAERHLMALGERYPTRPTNTRVGDAHTAAPVLSADDLHAAADAIGGFGDDDARIGEWGLPMDVLHEFIDGSSWTAGSAAGSKMSLDPLALALGISIGVVAANERRGPRQPGGEMSNIDPKLHDAQLTPVEADALLAHIRSDHRKLSDVAILEARDAGIAKLEKIAAHERRD